MFDYVIDDLSDTALQKALSEEELFALFDLKPKRLSAQTAKVSAALPRERNEGYVFTPEEPFSNVTKLRQILRECEEYIWWEDPNFGTRALEELVMVVDPSKVKEIKILSRREQLNEKALKDFKRFCDEMGPKGISVEWRVTDKSVAHDRFIITAKVAYNLPPVNSIYQGAYGEALKTTNRPPFEQWWEQASMT